MELSIFLAKLLGLYMLIIAAIMLFRKNTFQFAIHEMISSIGLIIFIGILNLIVGLAIVLGHSVWEWNWRGLITLLGYLSLIKGVSRIAFPQEEIKMAKSVMQGWGYWVVWGITLVLGIFLTYKGFGIHI